MRAFNRSTWRRWVTSVVAACLLSSCTTRVWQAEFYESERLADLDIEAPFLKCHMPDGRLYVLTSWDIDPGQGVIEGRGLEYDSERKVADRGNLTVPIDEVALLETNRPEEMRRNDMVALAFISGVSLTITALCLANPKSCFGSCPTFYVDTASGEALEAEGFSHSIAKAFEATDVDALERARPDGTSFTVEMANEALETHMVRHVDLLAVPRPDDGRVYRAGERFFQVGLDDVQPPTSCEAGSTDCLDSVREADEREYRSLASDENLAAKETIELTFPPSPGPSGLIVRARNSLLNTFLFYQALAYMGRSAGEWFAKLERSPAEMRELIPGVGDVLGDIEVHVRDAKGRWVHAGAFDEIGPIARDNHLIELPQLPDGELADDSPVKVRLTLTQGNWKIDQLAVVSLGEQVEPVRVKPTGVERDGNKDAAALEKLRDRDLYLMTYPGDRYTLTYRLPEGPSEFFLESRGYYYEWMRKQWLDEEDPQALRELLTDPKRALRKLAPAYKEIEGSIEENFWKSRIGREEP